MDSASDQIRPGERQVQLADGREVSSCSEEWRAECEARTVLGWPREQRQAFYVSVAKKRGEEAARKLINDVKRLHAATRGAA